MPKKKNSGLGRGLDAIFFENTPVDDTKAGENKITVIRLSLIDPKKDQPRKYFDKEALEDLANSIAENGLLQPIVVREYGEGRYQIIAGERRFRASKMAGLSEIPAIVLDRSDKSVAELSLIENIQREDLNPIEEAMGYKTLAETYGMTQEEISLTVGKSRSAVANSMRLLDLPDPILTMVAAGELSAGHARTLLGVKDPDDMLVLAQVAAEEGMSVRRLEEEVKRINRKKPKKDEEPEVEPLVNYTREIELRIQRHLGRKAKIKDSGKKKTLTLFYEDNEDLDELLKLICGADFLDEE